MGNLKGLGVIVTGGTGGIGKKLVEAFLSAGSNVLVSGRSSHKLEKTLKDFSNNNLFQCLTDVQIESDIIGLFKKACEVLRSIDIVINNAGVSHPPEPIENLSLDDWHRVINTNLTAPFKRQRF